MPQRQTIARVAQAGLLATSLFASALAAATAPTPSIADAASHREAPLISEDPEADISDCFFFRAYEPGKGDKAVFVMDVIPGEEPSSGPNYFNFGRGVKYSFNVDNDGDGKAEDIVLDFEFRTERVRGTIDNLDLPLALVGVPPITALDGNGSEGIGIRQRYSVTLTKEGRSRKIADNLIAVPSTVGPRTMPTYDALAAQGVYSIENDIRVFAGQGDDPFYIDLGAIFDTLNLRNPGTDMLSGFNVNAIAVEVPIAFLTSDGKGSKDMASPNLGMYCNTSRRKMTVLRENGGIDDSGPWVQVQRLANPLMNELIIGTEDKDRWNALDPSDERRFLDYYRNPRLAVAFNAVLGVPVPATPRDDLVNVLLKYGPDDRRLSELLRCDLSVDPTPLAQQNRLGVAFSTDKVGWPNCRRPIDDVTDIAIRVVGGPALANAGDNVNNNDKPYPNAFPYLASPWDGRNRVHQNP
jgi:Domain of unknown function (DUF4331)